MHTACVKGTVRIAHRPQRLIDAFAGEPEVSPDWNLDVASVLTQLLTATCVGLLSESAEQTPPDKPMRSTTGTSWRHGRTRPSCHSAPDRTVVSVRRWGICRCNSCSPSFADPCPASEAVFARDTPEHRTSSSAKAPCLPGSERPQRQIHHCWSQREVTIARTMRRAPFTELCHSHSGTLPNPRTDPVGLQ